MAAKPGSSSMPGCPSCTMSSSAMKAANGHVHPKMTMAADDAYDRKRGIKENSKRDMAMDRKRGVK